MILTYVITHTQKKKDWTCPSCGANVFASKLACYKCRTPRPAGTGEVKPLPNIPSRPGDWKYVIIVQIRRNSLTSPRIKKKQRQHRCPNCEANCFARTTSCFRCQTLRPAGAGQNGYNNNNTFKKEIGPGDWFCTQCTALCYANRTACYKCGAPKPADMLNDNFGGGGDKSGGGYNNRNHYNSNAGVRNYRSRPGDWTCPSCNSNVFAYKAQCFRCGEARPAHLGPVPKKEVRPGDWKCEKCEEICFGSRYTCYKCGADRPKSTYPKSRYRPRDRSRSRERRRSRSRSRERRRFRSRSRERRYRSRSRDRYARERYYD